jgi:hypothetical protein
MAHTSRHAAVLTGEVQGVGEEGCEREAGMQVGLTATHSDPCIINQPRAPHQQKLPVSAHVDETVRMRAAGVRL